LICDSDHLATGPIPSGAMDKPQKIRDRKGREVLLSVERWQDIVSGYPEIEVYEQEVRRAVESPTAVLPGPGGRRRVALPGGSRSKPVAEGRRDLR